jgi:hypothetical protein
MGAREQSERGGDGRGGGTGGQASGDFHKEGAATSVPGPGQETRHKTLSGVPEGEGRNEGGWEGGDEGGWSGGWSPASVPLALGQGIVRIGPMEKV